MKPFVLALVLAVSAVGTGAAATVEVPADMVPCQLHALSVDDDPAGLNVRAAPSASAAVLARLPKWTKADNGPYPELTILGFKDGWFLIEGAHYGDYGDPPPPKPLYAGRGWVHGSKLGGTLMGGDQSSRILMEPRAGAPRVSVKGKADSADVRALLECKGDWAKVRTGVGTGWARGICANQVTTCN